MVFDISQATASVALDTCAQSYASLETPNTLTYLHSLWYETNTGHDPTVSIRGYFQYNGTDWFTGFFTYDPAIQSYTFLSGVGVNATNISNELTSAELADLTLFYTNPNPICFHESTNILVCNLNGTETYVNIRELYPSSNYLIKTHCGKKLPIRQICRTIIRNNPSMWKACMYYMPRTNLMVTGQHSILVKELTPEQHQWYAANDVRVQMLDDHYLLLASASSEFVPVHGTEEFVIYHFCLETDNPEQRFGIWANTVLTETTNWKEIKKYFLHGG